MRIYRKTLLSLLVIMIPAVAHAGAGAVINGCVYLPTAPPYALTVNFATLGNHCMSSIGSSTSMSVSAAGLTCASVGYVEAQASTT